MHLTYRNGRPYLRRSVRRNGRVTSEYVASGDLAVLLARMNAQEREARDAELAQARAQREADEAREAALDDYFDRVEDLARSFLFAAGFHYPKYRWRRRYARRRER